MKLQLPSVTLIAITGRNVDSHEKALEHSCKDIDFGDAKVVYDPTITSIDEWNYKVIFELGKYVHTKHALLFHDDGFVVNAKAWNPAWLEYDYIGAPWPLPTDDYSYRDVKGNIVRVGNSVSLRSKKILDLPRELNLEWKQYYGNTNEDGYLTCHQRHILEAHGCTFADIDVAKYFSRETPLPENVGINPFMFHRYVGDNSKYPRFK